MHEKAAEILEFWRGIGPAGWFRVSETLDQEIRDRFLGLWEQVRDGAYSEWQIHPDEALAAIILLDQFPRNMFRGDPRSFATDTKARCIARKMMRFDYDLALDPELRRFVYLPFMHSESLLDQDESVRAFLTRMPEAGDLLHPRAHRQVIRDFGRFPYRNDALGRISTQNEQTYLKAGGYSATLHALEAQAGATSH